MNASDSLPPALRPALDQVAQRWGFNSFQPVLLQNLEFCDQMLQLIDDNFPLTDEIRRETYANFIGPGPGGLRAFHWLLRHDHLDRALVRDYLGCLQVGPARTGALSEEEAAPLLMALFEHWQGENEEIVLPALCQFLNSNALNARARAAAFREALSERHLAADWRLRLAHWAARSNRNDSDLPLSHLDLHKPGFLACVAQGEGPAQVLDEALRQSAQGPSNLRDSAGQACLDLVENYAREIPEALQQSALYAMKDAPLSRIRRRAFQLLEQSEGEDWVHHGLRDRDAGVRSWALLRANQIRGAERTA